MPTDVERAIHDYFLKHDLFFQTQVDDYLKWMPFAAVAVADLRGVRTHSSWRKQVLIAVLTEAIRYFIANGLKNVTKERRPVPNFDKRSFPSGHSSASFSAAQFMHHELRESLPVMSCAGYACAITTGIFRLMKNRHWLKDVLAGMAIGWLSAKFAFLFVKWCSSKMRSSEPKQIEAY